MSVEDLMTLPVTLRTRDGETRSSIGSSEPTFASLDTLMALEPRSGREEANDGDIPIGDWVGAGNKDIDFKSWAQVIWGEHTFEILSVMPGMNLRTGELSHYELDLQEVQVS